MYHYDITKLNQTTVTCQKYCNNVILRYIFHALLPFFNEFSWLHYLSDLNEFLHVDKVLLSVFTDNIFIIFRHLLPEKPKIIHRRKFSVTLFGKNKEENGAACVYVGT